MSEVKTDKVNTLANLIKHSKSAEFYQVKGKGTCLGELRWYGLSHQWMFT